jgi:SNF2 family DNA or RNA helicase
MQLLGTHREFISTFSKPIEMGQDRMATESTVLRAHQTAEELWLTISPYLLQRSKADIESSKGNLSTAGPKGQSLPTKTELVAWVSLSPEQRRIYSEFLEGGRVTDVLMGAVSSPLAAITHLKKICAHPLLCAEQQQSQIPLEDDDGDADVQADGVSSPVKKPKPQWRLDPSISTEQLITGSRKLGVVLSLIQTLWSEGHRTLVFSQSIRMLDIVQRCIQQGVAGVGLKHNRIDGASSDMERKSCIDQFNEDPSIGVCLLSTKVGGYGITLTGADRVIVYDPSWNPAEDRQAVDRAYRIGQTRDVVVYRVITAGTVEVRQKVLCSCLF